MSARVVAALIAGALFGLGLSVSGMIDPARVLGFLDVAGGAWDPTLAFVMGGALAPMALAWRLAAQRASVGAAPILGGVFPPRPVSGIDARLLGGAAVFGVGWGLVGLCPGPALAALTLGGWPVALFVAAMLAGFALHRLATRPEATPRGV